MKLTGCPGQDLRFRTVDNIIYTVICNECGNEVEFFFDDRKRICEKCNANVQPDLETLKKYHNCGSNCKSARECLGEKKYQQLVLTEQRTSEQGQNDLEMLLSLIPENEKETIAFLTKVITSNIRVGFLLNPETDIDILKNSDPILYRKITNYISLYCDKVERLNIS